ncbi:hypothetical protein [Streptomyces sp. NPDC058718]|uniref:hypothetical protein n=1 Tax=Streptomyces sp. NPDC058718 TaxID=3346610 RepID=UPI003680A03A
MTFEYRDHDGDSLTVAPMIDSGERIVGRAVETAGGLCAMHIPLDHVEEVVAGIRDTARQAGAEPTRPAGCRTTQHCATHDFCHRCMPSLNDATRHLVKAIDAAGITTGTGRVYAALAATVRDAARTASGQQPETKPAYYGVNGCTCRAWTDGGGVPRFLRGDESVELISGWEEQPDCPHHAPAVNGQKPEATPCGSRSLPTYSGEVVHCVLKIGHAAQCQSVGEWPYVSWPNPSHGDGWRTAGQPAEAHTADRAAVLDEAADRAEQLGLHLSDKGENIRSSGAYEVMTELRRMAEEARS